MWSFTSEWLLMRGLLTKGSIVESKAISKPSIHFEMNTNHRTVIRKVCFKFKKISMEHKMLILLGIHLYTTTNYLKVQMGNTKRNCYYPMTEFVSPTLGTLLVFKF